MPIYLRWFIFVSIAAVLSCIFYPGKAHKTYFISQQMFVSFTLYIEALSLVSQLYHMHIGNVVDGLNKRYLAALGVSRLTRIGFWVSMSSRLSTFWFLIAADTVHTLMVIGFGLSFMKIHEKTKNRSGVLSMDSMEGETELKHRD